MATTLKLDHQSRDDGSVRQNRSFQKSVRRRAILLAAAASAMVGFSRSDASIVVWDGNGADNNWSTGLNWLGNAAPVAGDSLVFDQAHRLTPTNDETAATLFNGLTFTTSAGAFSLSGNSITLGGDIVDSSVNAESSSIPLILSATRTVNVSSRIGALTLSGLISGTGFGITKTGDGILTLSGLTNTFTGPVEIDGGVIAITADSTGASNPLGSGASGARLTLNGGTLRTSTTLQVSTNRLITLGASGGTWDVGSATTTYNGVISGGSNSFTKTGVGTLVLGGTNTYTGDTNVNQGTLEVDFSQIAGTTSSINASSRLVLGGPSATVGTPSNTAGVSIVINGRGSTTRTQTFNGLILGGTTPATAGVYSTISTTTIGNGVIVNLGAITHNAGGLVNFSRTGSVTAANSIMTTTANNAAGILGGWALYGNDWAVNDGSNNITNLTTYDQNLTGTTGAINDGANDDVKLAPTAVAAYTLNGTPGAAVTVDTLNSAGTAAATINLAATDTLRLGAQGGVLVGTSAGTLTIGQTAGQGKITAGGADNTAGEISFINLNTLGTPSSLAINAGIVDNGTGAVSVTYYAGAGGIALAGAGSAFVGTSTYTGGTVIAGGRVLTGANDIHAFGTGSVTVLQGGQAGLSATVGSKIWANNFFIAGSGFASATTGAIAIGAKPTGISAGISGNITLIGDAKIAATSDTTAIELGILSGQITGNYALELGNSSANNISILQLSNQGIGGNANNWTGNTTISETVQLSGALTATDLLPDGAGKGNIIFNAANVATLDLNGKSETVNAISGSGTNGIVTNTAVGTASVFTLGNGDATATYAGKVIDHATTGGTVAIVKTGAGTETFSGANSYSGGTAVQNGRLIVASGGTLGTGDVTVTGSGSVLELDATTDSAAIADTSNLYLSSNGLVELDYSGTETINALQLNGTFLATGIYNAASLATAGYISGAGSLTVTATPEPTSLGLFGLGACGVLARRRRAKTL